MRSLSVYLYKLLTLEKNDFKRLVQIKKVRKQKNIYNHKPATDLWTHYLHIYEFSRVAERSRTVKLTNATQYSWKPRSHGLPTPGTTSGNHLVQFRTV